MRSYEHSQTICTHSLICSPQNQQSLFFKKTFNSKLFVAECFYRSVLFYVIIVKNNNMLTLATSSFCISSDEFSKLGY